MFFSRQSTVLEDNLLPALHVNKRQCCLLTRTPGVVCRRDSLLTSQQLLFTPRLRAPSKRPRTICANARHSAPSRARRLEAGRGLRLGPPTLRNPASTPAPAPPAAADRTAFTHKTPRTLAGPPSSRERHRPARKPPVAPPRVWFPAARPRADAFQCFGAGGRGVSGFRPEAARGPRPRYLRVGRAAVTAAAPSRRRRAEGKG